MIRKGINVMYKPYMFNTEEYLFRGHSSFENGE